MDDQNQNPQDPNTQDSSPVVSSEASPITEAPASEVTEESANPFAALKQEPTEEAKEEMKNEDAAEEATIDEPEVTASAVIPNQDEGSIETSEQPAESASKAETDEPKTDEPDSENGELKTDNSETTEAVEEPKEEEKLTVPTNPNARWYVVHTFAGHENKVAAALRQRIEAEHLENLIYDILVPTQDKIEIKGGKKETVKEKIFPGYILIKMELSDLSWLAVRTTQGVTSFIGAGTKPTPISEAEVASIVKFTTQGASPTFKDVFMVDDTVKIIDGPFAEFIGKVDSVDKEKGRVRVLVSIFGRETPVELDFLQVQKL